LKAAGIVNGDLIAAQSAIAALPSAPPPTASTPAGSGGLDFSNLFAAQSAGSTNAASASLLSEVAPAPSYYPGMSLSDAVAHNPHPHTFVSLLFSKEHLRKELNYHNPRLAVRLESQSLEEAVRIWREEMVKGGIQKAVQNSSHYHIEQDMKRRLVQNPGDIEAKRYFAKQSSQEFIQEQYYQMMNEYPEAMGRVLMLYVEANINGHSIQAFCDSGAQATIMSKKTATQCGVLDLIDERFAGTAVGVGTGKILGRIHMVQMQIGDSYFPCSVTVMDDPGEGAAEMPFLLGLDMMKRHTCSIDLERGVLKFRLAPGQYMETPFLHEKDLAEAQGGTKGFDPQKSNEEFLRRQREESEDDPSMKD
jgi:DNA damage-inducible protein 1